MSIISCLRDSNISINFFFMFILPFYKKLQSVIPSCFFYCSVLTVRAMIPAITMTTDKLINTIEKDPPNRETKAPNVIGAIKPPIVDPVLIIPIDEPITFPGRILCGQENTPTKKIVIQNVSKYNNVIDNANESVSTKPANAKAERIALIKNNTFSFPAKNFVNSIPANKEAMVPQLH